MALVNRQLIGRVARIIHREIFGVWRNGDVTQADSQHSSLVASRKVLRHLGRLRTEAAAEADEGEDSPSKPE